MGGLLQEVWREGLLSVLGLELPQGRQAGNLRSPGRIRDENIRSEGRGGEMGLQISEYTGLGPGILTQFYRDALRFIIILQTILTLFWFWRKQAEL